MPSWITAPTEQYPLVQTDPSNVVALPHFQNPAQGQPINPQSRRGSAFPVAGEKPMHVGDSPVEPSFDHPPTQEPHVKVEYLPRRPLVGRVKPQYLLSDGRPEQSGSVLAPPSNAEAIDPVAAPISLPAITEVSDPEVPVPVSGDAAEARRAIEAVTAEAAAKPAAREVGRVMSGPYREMIISGREPRVGRDLVEKLYGLQGDLMASVHLNYRVPPIDRTVKDQVAARNQAYKETRPRAHANELVVLDVSTGGAGGKAQYMVTTRTFLNKLEKTPRLFRGWRMRRNQDEVRVLGPDESLQVGRGEAPAGETPRWIPGAILAQEKTAHDQVLGDNQGTFRVSSNGVLSYESTGQADDETLEARTLPQEDAYDAAVKAFESAAKMFRKGNNTMDEVEAAKAARFQAAHALPAGPERINLPQQRTVPAASILARLAAERATDRSVGILAPSQAAQPIAPPVIPGRSVPAPRLSPEASGEANTGSPTDQTEEFEKVT